MDPSAAAMTGPSRALRPFLSASWRHLAMLSYEVDPAAVAPLVPRGTRLDSFAGRTFASVVGFLFLDTRLRGVAIPFHRDFEEVNLRFYVRREHPDGPRRGVTFVKEIVPRRAIAWVARWRYGEPYAALPMRHRLDEAGPERAVEYGWRAGGHWSTLALRARGEPAQPAPASEEEFIAEHYWGYTAQRGGGTIEYEVRHPPWRVWRAISARLDCDASAIYGPRLGQFLSGVPASAFLAEGSPVVVAPPVRLAG